MLRLLYKAVVFVVRAVITVCTRWMRPGHELAAARTELEAQRQRAEIAEGDARYVVRELEDLRMYVAELLVELDEADADVLMLEAELAIAEQQHAEPPHHEESARG